MMVIISVFFLTRLFFSLSDINSGRIPYFWGDDLVMVWGLHPQNRHSEPTFTWADEPRELI